MTRKPLADMIRSRPAAKPTRAGASADYALVKQNFDLITKARSAGLGWREIAEAAEFEGLAANDPAAILRSYYSKLNRSRAQKGKALAAPQAASPTPSAGPTRPLPPPPGAAPRPAAGDIFANLPKIPTGKDDK